VIENRGTALTAKVVAADTEVITERNGKSNMVNWRK
jgi:hypothetical protein